jgi:hypothetical protein|tara:strand:+ start:917 stop:1684 length:768 start_codon:yes stop_codon:yes gene_type:complete
MPLTSKGKKIMSAMKEQYGKDAERVFYASKNKGTIKGVDVMKAFKGAQADTKKGQAMSPGTGATGGTRGMGRNPMAQFEGPKRSYSQEQRQTLAKQRKDLQYLITPSSSPKNRAIALAAGLVVPGGGFLYKRAIDQNTIFAPKRKKSKTPLIQNNNNRNNNTSPTNTQTPIIPKIEANKPIDPLLIKPKDNFFNFRAFNSGGVSFGPPPKRGPNPQVPPVKMKSGKMNNMSCPHRPDGIRGMGAAIKGSKFIGVK